MHNESAGIHRLTSGHGPGKRQRLRFYVKVRRFQLEGDVASLQLQVPSVNAVSTCEYRNESQPCSQQPLQQGHGRFQRISDAGHLRHKDPVSIHRKSTRYFTRNETERTTAVESTELTDTNIRSTHRDPTSFGK